MTLDEQIEFIDKLSIEFTNVDRRMKDMPGYDGSYMEDSGNLDEVSESLNRLRSLIN